MAPDNKELAFLQMATSTGLCLRCALRYQAIHDLERYETHSMTQLSTQLASACASKAPADADDATASVCCCCLGILSDEFHETLLTQLTTATQATDSVDEVQYDAKSFVLALKVPSAVLIRERSLAQHFATVVEPVELKEILRSRLTTKLQELLNGAVCIAANNIHGHPATLTVSVDIHHLSTNEEPQQLDAIRQQTVQLAAFRKRKRNASKQVPVVDGFGAVSRAISALSKLPDTVPCPPTRVADLPTCVIQLQREPVYLQGRYLKYQRGLSQTPWVLDGKRMGESSVEECIGDVAVKFFKGKSYKFHTAGREDVDVRMLGNGRPFILEVLDAKKAHLTPDEYKEIEQAVNNTNEDVVKIRNVQESNKDYFAGLQQGADSKKKTYCCVVWSAKPITPEAVARLDTIHDLSIDQKTPVRVLHRRTLLTRPKIIHDARCEVLNQHYMLLRLTTSAGTYVKEFVHGDLGRTQPNVSTFLECDTDILQLDVENLIDEM